MPEQFPKPEILSTRRFDTTKVLLTIFISLFVLVMVTFAVQWYVKSQERGADDFIRESTSRNSQIATKSASKSATKVDTSDWKTYLNNKSGYRYEFKYPKGWEIRVDPKDSLDSDNISLTTLQLTTPDYVLGETNMTAGSIIYIKKPKLVPTGKKTVDYLWELVTEISPKQSGIGGNETETMFWFDTTLKQGNVQTPTTQYYVTNNKMVAPISRQYLEGKKGEYESIVQTIFSTFKFL